MLSCTQIQEARGLPNSFSSQLGTYIRRTGFPVRRVANWSGIPRQTLFNWLAGTHPRWYSALTDDLFRLGDILNLTDDEMEMLLQFAGCSPRQGHRWFTQEIDMSEKLNQPQGWFASGSHPQLYSFDLDREMLYNGKVSVTIKAGEHWDGFATLMQQFKAGAYIGKRLRFSAAVRCEGVERWAGLWMRMDAKDGTCLAFDNMQSRPITGTSDWQIYQVVLDVSEEASLVNFGFMLTGPGQVWMAGVTLDEVGAEVPVTEVTYPDHPVNLSFTEEA